MINKLIAENGSRRACRGLVDKLDSMYADTERLNLLAVMPNHTEEFGRQAAIEIALFTQIETAKEDVDEFINSRADEASSIASFQPLSIRSEELRNWTQTTSQALADAKQKAEEAQRNAEKLQKESVDAKRKAEEANKEVANLTGAIEKRKSANTVISDGQHDWGDKETAINDWRRKSLIEPRSRETEEEGEPDCWIDRYCSGLEDPTWIYSHKAPSLKSELPVFSGKAFDWFSWIDLYRSMVHDQRISAGEKLAILKSRLSGEQLDIVQGLGGGEPAYKSALSRLKQAAGRRDVMRVAYLSELDRMDLGRDPTKLQALTSLNVYAGNFIQQIDSSGIPEEELDWSVEVSTNLGSGSVKELRLIKTRTILQQKNHLDLGLAVHDIVRPPLVLITLASNQIVPTSLTKVAVIVAMKSTVFYLAQGSYRPQAMPTKEKIRFCIRRRLCLKCFGAKHSAKDCTFGKGCGVKDCPYEHHSLLHDAGYIPTVKGDSHHTSLSARADQMKVALGVIRTEAYAMDGTVIPVSVMIDEGSDTTLFREDFLRRLKIIGKKQKLDLVGVTGAERYDSQRADVRFRLPDGEETIIAGLTIPQVARPTPIVNWDELKQRWPHLADVPVMKSGGKIDVLLALDHSHLIAVLESRVGGDDEPFASRTRLGWIVRGLLGGDIGPMTARSYHLTATSREEGPAVQDSLDAEFRAFCETENFGTEFRGEGVSESEQKAEKIVNEGLRKLEVGYEAPLTWIEGEPAFENNRKLAQHRLQDLRQRFKKNPKLEEDYRKAINKYIDEGYASLVEDENLYSNDQFYLPHHGVYKKVYRKKERKLRVVFDGASRWKRKSLNDGMRPGPKLQNDLAKVLIRFQQGEIAFSADITAMYSRIRLKPSDARFHRFLWQEPGSEKIFTYQMDRLPFGLNCSPFIALKTVQRAAADAKTGKKDCIEAVENNMYMDDLLKAADSEELAIDNAKNIRDGLAGGDFHLTNWISNSPKLVAALQPIESSTVDSTCSLASDEAEKLLGIFYEPSTDDLTFRVTGADEVEWTRAGLLSKVAAVYDPLGRAAPLIVKAKIKLRELGIKGLNWKDVVTGEDKAWWQRWFSTLKQLNSIRMPRNFQPNKRNIKRSQLLTFCDASEEVVAAAVYLNTSYEDGSSSCRLVMVKTKLAPRKTISIPKLELNAALLGARLSRYVEEALNLPGLTRLFWTDSSTTRNWLRAVVAHYTPFVSHRIGEIQSVTDPSEWRFVPGKQNIADVATRSLLVDEEPIPPGWLEGPDFLKQPVDLWPKDLPWMAVSVERRASYSQHLTKTRFEHDWSKLKIDSSNLSSCLKMECPYQELVRRCQEEESNEEIQQLHRNRPLSRTSRLQQLSPFLDSDGILRLGGRIRRARLPYDILHPPILPGKHVLAEAIIIAIHNEEHHVGTDFLHSKARQHFWILQGKELAKKIRFKCSTCIKTRAKLATQKMGDLPAARLDSYSAPFTHVTLDYFGPVETSAYRGRITKRYGLLLSCCVTRYVYLDLAQSLSTPDFLYCFRRFVGEYTKPSEVFSDNGTNFVGAEKEMVAAVRELQMDDKFQEFVQTKSIVWKFQPPSAPHFGGSHESLVKSVKRALYRALDTEKASLRYPTDEMLRTLLKEVSGQLNSRPLTLASNDPEDFRPITPRYFLNLPPTSDLPAGIVKNALPRDHVRYVKKMANLVWDLWTKFYLPTLIPRRKWTREERNFVVGDAVMVSESNLPPSQWKTGRVIEVFPGSDGLVRVVKVKTGSGDYLRAIH
ncbi:uncharacterized protein LOC116935689 [Daphnia magna]|uniref:uncharacterized protein LOC116935689 n=1 Tax=Daphnia magna TaxID=35525 RepID=UPI001E1BA102|nr:uncharacterized protein LOC116935689 [Daphnia magna]